MNYTKIYDNIINNAINEYRLKSRAIIYESHHIVPKCMGGTNEKSNLVLLTPKEHFVCHQLLCHIYPKNNKLKFALWGMCNQLNGDVIRNYTISANTYAWAKKLQYEANSKLHKGKILSDGHRKILKYYAINHNPNKGKFGKLNPLWKVPRTNEIKSKISISKLLNPSKNCNYRGQYITPAGIFESPLQAALAMNISRGKIYNRCKSKNTIVITSNILNRNFDLSTDCLNKTFKEMGWGFLPLK